MDSHFANKIKQLELPLTHSVVSAVRGIVSKVAAPDADADADAYADADADAYAEAWKMTRCDLQVEQASAYDELVAFIASEGFGVGERENEMSWLAEYHTVSAGLAFEPSLLSIHQDDYGGVAGEVITLIVYLHVGADVVGGNLLVYHDDNAAHDEPAFVVSTRARAGCARVVVMRGDVFHMPEGVRANGADNARNVFVFQCPRAPEPLA